MTTHIWRAQSIYKTVQSEHNDSQMFIAAGTEECTAIANSPFSAAKQFWTPGQRVKKYLPAQHACTVYKAELQTHHMQRYLLSTFQLQAGACLQKQIYW